ncbi:hypothetical protein VNO78_15822 [Psophocarpus tetragonolobus]|uniref:Uncharacterized protein n=1 Tax=Psophocarpus tetragonolobus TaxID=3891 RepID=A0AAN9SG29_PSOTE
MNLSTSSPQPTFTTNLTGPHKKLKTTVSPYTVVLCDPTSEQCRDSTLVLNCDLVKWGAMEWEDECRTPRLLQNQIPAVFICPPRPPRKKPVAGKRRPPPKEGYFHPPDLDSLFSVSARKEACV